MAERRVLIDGFPPGYSSRKAKALLENHCQINILNLEVKNSRAEVSLSNDQDAEILRNQYPKSLQFGDETYQLNLGNPVGALSQSPDHYHGDGYQHHGSQFTSEGRTQHAGTALPGGYLQPIMPPHNVLAPQAYDMRYASEGTSSPYYGMDQNQYSRRQREVHSYEQMNIRGQAQQTNVGMYQPPSTGNYGMTVTHSAGQETQPFGPHHMPGVAHSQWRMPDGSVSSLQGNINTGVASADPGTGYRPPPKEAGPHFMPGPAYSEERIRQSDSPIAEHQFLPQADRQHHGFVGFPGNNPSVPYNIRGPEQTQAELKSLTTQTWGPAPAYPLPNQGAPLGTMQFQSPFDSNINQQFHHRGGLETSPSRGQNPGPRYRNSLYHYVGERIGSGTVTDHRSAGQSNGAVRYRQRPPNVRPFNYWYPGVGYGDGSESPASTGHEQGHNTLSSSGESSYQTFNPDTAPASRMPQNYTTIGRDGYGHNTTDRVAQHQRREVLQTHRQQPNFPNEAAFQHPHPQSGILEQPYNARHGEDGTNPQPGLKQELQQSAMSNEHRRFIQPPGPRMVGPQGNLTQKGTEFQGPYPARLDQSNIQMTSFSNTGGGHTDLLSAPIDGSRGPHPPLGNSGSFEAANDGHGAHQQTRGGKSSQHISDPEMAVPAISLEKDGRNLMHQSSVAGEAEVRGTIDHLTGAVTSTDLNVSYGHHSVEQGRDGGQILQAPPDFTHPPSNRGSYDPQTFQESMSCSPQLSQHQIPVTTPVPGQMSWAQGHPTVCSSTTTLHDSSGEYTGMGTGGMATRTQAAMPRNHPQKASHHMTSHGTGAHMSGTNRQPVPVSPLDQDYSNRPRRESDCPQVINRDADDSVAFGHHHASHDPPIHESHSAQDHHRQPAPIHSDDQLHENAPATSSHVAKSQSFSAAPPELHLDKVYTWSTIDLPDDIGTRGMLVNEIPEELSPEELVTHFSKSGGPIKSALSMVDGILIVFHSSSDLRRVINAKMHNVGDSSIRVFEKKIPTQYRDRFVLKDPEHKVDEMDEDTLKLTLKNCDTRGGCGPRKFTRCGSNFVLIEYDQEPDDLQAIKEAFTAKLKRKKGFQALSLRKTDCLRVHDGPFDVNIDPVAIQAVLEDREHGGGQVTRIDRLRDGSYLVYFSSAPDVEKLYKKFEDKRIRITKHEFKFDLYFHLLSNDHQQLAKKHEMDEYYAKWRDTESAPETFSFLDIDLNVLKFLSEKPEHLQFLKSSLQDLAIANIQTAGLEITPDLDSPRTRDRPRDHSMFKTECIRKIEQFLKDYSSEKKKFNEENLQKVRRIKPDSKVATSYIGDNEVSMRWSDLNNSTLTVTGVKTRVESTLKDIMQLTDLKDQQLKLPLGKYKYATCCDILAMVQNKYAVGCVGNDKTSTISFTGTNQVTEARCELLSSLLEVSDQKFDPSDPTQIVFLSDPQYHETIFKKAFRIFKKNNIQAVLTIEGQTPCIWSNDCDKKTANGVLKDSLASDKSITLPTPAHKELLKVGDWRSLMNRVQRDKMVKITVDDLAITIGGFKDDVGEAKRKVAEFIDQNLRRSKEFLTNYGNAVNLEDYNTEFKAECKKHNIDYELKNNGIVLWGKQAALLKVIEQLTRWNARIKYQNEVVKQFNIVEYFELDSNKEKLANVSALYKCTIILGDRGWPEDSGQEARTGSSSNFGPLQVNVHGGDITDEKNDAIVNTVGSNFDLSKGQVSKSILRKCGEKIQREVLRDLDTDLRVTTANGLRCKFVLHVVSPQRVDEIKHCLMRILMEAEKRDCVSVSIPAIGTGQLGLPSTSVAKLMRQTLVDFATENPQTKRLKIVDIVIFHPQMLADFRSVFASDQRDKNTRQPLPAPTEREGPLQIVAARSQGHQVIAISSANESPFRSAGNTSSLQGQRQPTSHYNTGDRNTTSPVSGHSGVIAVSVRQGDITNEKTDAIVNSTGADFNLSKGMVSKSIISKGGQQIQHQVSAASGKFIRVTSGGKLSCNHIIHVVAPDKVEAIKDRLLNVLQEADKCQCSSLSIPAIGTGNLGLRSSSVANIMKEAFLEVPAKLPFIRYLRTVDVVIFERSMVQDFQSVLTLTVNVSTSKGIAHSSSTFQTRPSVASQVATASSSNAFGCLQVTVRQGDITDETSDAIINSTGSDFNLTKGMVSKAILRKGGQQIQQELSAEKDFSLRVTGGGNLKCGKIFHVVAPDQVQKIKDCVINILYEAERQRCKSLSLPAIGTGNLNLPPTSVAKIVRQALIEFALKKPQTTSLKIVDVVIYEPKFVGDFQAELSAGTAAVGTSTESLPAKSSTPPPSKSRPSTTASSSATIGPITLSVHQGDITEESSDAIVNSTGVDFNLSKGLVSRAILKKGGQDIQQEVSKAVGNKLRVTRGGKLKCKNILHAVAPDKVDKIKQCLINILEQAELQQCASLSIPAIGTGNLGLASSDVAKLMLEAFRAFAKACPQTKTLKTVDVVIYEATKLADFETGLIHPSPVDSSKKTGGIVGAMKSAMSTIGEKVSGTWKGVASAGSSSGPLHTTFQQLRVSVRQGDIVQEDKDAIVNITSGSFDLSKDVMSSPVVLASAGQQIQDELKKVADPELRVTSGGNLKVKKIIHVAVPDDVNDIKSLLKRILLEAESHSCTSISIPPIGEDQKLSGRHIANLMLEGIHHFASEGVGTKFLHSVDIIIPVDEEMLRAFRRAISSRASANVQRPSDGRERDPNSVTIHFYCAEKDGLEQARKSVMELVSGDFFTDSVEEASIGSLNNIQREEIAKIAEQNRVRLVYKSNENKIELDGLRNGIWETVKAIQCKLYEFSEARKLKSFTSYNWQYQLSIRRAILWKDFDPEADKILEELYQNSALTGTQVEIPFEMEMEMFKVDFELMMIDDGSEKFAIRRETKDDFPKTWDPMDDKMIFREVELSRSSQEYAKAEKKLTATLPKCQVVSISRIQNKNLYIRYKNQERLIRKVVTHKKIERQLFHGTCVVDKIINYGFDRNYAGDKNAAAHGQGTYFAVNANYSDQNKYATPDKDGVKTIILADVLTGDYCKGQKGMKSAPQKPKSGVVYDSVVNDTQNPTIFVVFPDASMYPAYVIRYKNLAQTPKT